MSGLTPEARQFAHRMLRRLGLQLARRGDIGHQRDVDAISVCSGSSSFRIWRIASMNGRLSISPTVPPISHRMKS
jgi:hypothetical protein